MILLLNRNRKSGNVPIILLFIVALVLVITTLFSFLTFNNDFGKQSKEMADIASKVEFGNMYVFKIAEISGKDAILSGTSEGDLKNKFMEIAEKRDYRIEETGNFFGKVRNGEFSFDMKDRRYILEIKGLFVQAEEWANKIKRNFDMHIEFNDKGEVIKRSA